MHFSNQDVLEIKSDLSYIREQMREKQEKKQKAQKRMMVAGWAILLYIQGLVCRPKSAYPAERVFGSFDNYQAISSSLVLILAPSR